MEMITNLIMHALHGLVYGMLLFLLASGLTLILGMMGVLNFAHGALYMAGAYFSFSILVWTGQFWLSLIIAPLLVGVIGILMERFLLRKVHVGGHVPELLLTFGVAYIIEDFVKLVWGTEPLRVDIHINSWGPLSRVPALYPVCVSRGVCLPFSYPLQDQSGYYRACRRG
jgi:branched-chain amino acid transport system permease protein